MGYDFPNTPLVGDTTTNNSGDTFEWDGVKWRSLRVSVLAGGVSSFNARTGSVVLNSADITSAAGALIDSPAFTGNPTAPTPLSGDADTSIATTAFVANAIATTPAAGVTTFNTRSGAVTLLATDVTAAGGAPVASPVLTGSPATPTAALDTNTTQIASTAFVLGQASAVLPLMDGTANIGSALRWARGDHRHPTDNTLLPISGGTLTGPLTLAGDPVSNLQPVTLQYFNSHAPTGGGAPTGPAGGDLTGTYPNPTLVGSGVVSGSYTYSSVTVDSKGRVTAASNGAAPPGPGATTPIMDGTPSVGSATTYARADHVHPTDTSRLASNAAAGGDLTGNFPSPTLVPTAVTAGTYTNTTLTVDAKGRLTAASSGTVVSPSSTLPIIDGIAAVGTGTTYARADHIHPTDVSRAPAITVSDIAPASPPANALWWDSVGGQLYLYYNDGNTTQWVPATTAGGNTNSVGRNLLHNPLFNIWQRGAGPWTTTSYTADRWGMVFNLDTISATIMVPNDTLRGQIGDEAAAYAMQYVVTGNAGAASYSLLYQPIEGVKRLGGKTVTVSFWARSVAAGLSVGVYGQQSFGTGGSPSAVVQFGPVAIPISTTFTRYSATIAIPSTVGKILGTNGDDYTRIQIALSSGSASTAVTGIGVQSGTFQFWGMQLEVGSVATPLEKPDPQQDLAKCQRFYQVGAILGSGYSAAAGGTIYHEMSLPVLMRAAPTVAVTTNSSSGLNSPNVITVGLMPAGAVAGTGTTSAAGLYLANMAFTASADL